MTDSWVGHCFAFFCLCVVGSFVGSGCSTSDENEISCSNATAKLEACGLIGSGASFYCTDSGTDRERCWLECTQKSTCAYLEATLCLSTTVTVTATSVEEDCYATCYAQTQLPCGDGQTYDELSACNGFPSCANGTDEADCPVSSCANGEPIWLHNRCNGTVDCSDTSDETDCPTFTCTSGETVPSFSRCDYITNCEDGSDEAGCAPGLNEILTCQ